MKRTLMTLLTAWAALTGTAQVQPTSALVGTWSGKLDLGGVSLTLVFHLEQADDYVAVTMDSPDQGAKGIGCRKDYLSDDSLAVSVPMINATYRARLDGDKLDGTFAQSGLSLSLALTKGEPQANRPQRPQPPYPYTTQEVTFKNEADGATLAGTLTFPVDFDKRKAGSVPVLLMVSGSGQQNRNEELMQHEPFLVIADHLARHGIATLRYDDRATAASTGGEVKTATTADFMRDAAAGIDFLRGRKEFGKVGCMGHSEGGTIAFMLAARGKTDFIVTLAAPGVKGDTLLTVQSNRIMTLSGKPADMTVETLRQQAAIAQIPWMQWFMDYDPSDDIRKTRCPVMALNGENDSQVVCTQNLPAIQQLLPPSKKHLCKSYPSLNHLFQHCSTGLPNEYSLIEETIAPEVLSDMAAWIGSLDD